jgi:glycosyltransferase involved in cell wall biosynthesis
VFRINVAAYRYIAVDGYGRFAMAIIKALHETGKIDVFPCTVDMLDHVGWMRSMMGIDLTKLTLSIMPFHELRNAAMNQWAFSMYESTKLPAGWAKHANTKAELAIAPCEWVADVFRDNGVKIPIHVVYGGTDTIENALLPQRPIGTRPYTFIALGDRGGRKGDDIVWAAFCQAFKPTDDVRLIIKTRESGLPHLANINSPDPMTGKIRIWREDVDNMRDVFAHADCAVYPAKSDGWGMWPREAASCGLPVIATNATGTAVGCEQWAYPLNDFVWADSPLPEVGGGGKWAKPRVDEVAYWMRYCYENREAAQQKGLDAAAWIRAHQTWGHTAQQLLSLIQYGEVGRFEAVARAEHARVQALADGAAQLTHALSMNGRTPHDD